MRVYFRRDWLCECVLGETGCVSVFWERLAV